MSRTWHPRVPNRRRNGWARKKYVWTYEFGEYREWNHHTWSYETREGWHHKRTWTGSYSSYPATHRVWDRNHNCRYYSTRFNRTERHQAKIDLKLGREPWSPRTGRNRARWEAW